MIIPGSRMLFKIGCPDCGVPQQQGENSDFFVFRCANEECPSWQANILVERRSGMILSNDAHYVWSNGRGGVVAQPMLADKDGKQVWPVPKV